MAENSPSDLFRFDVPCDHTPEFQSSYELIFKSNIVYTDEKGIGHSFPNNLSEEGQNNYVSPSSENTIKAMEIANKMQGKKMDKVYSTVSKDFKALNLKPSCSIFYGKREKEVEGKKKGDPKELKEDNGLVSFLKLKGFVMIDNLFSKDIRSITTQQSSINIFPIAQDPVIYH